MLRVLESSFGLGCNGRAHNLQNVKMGPKGRADSLAGQAARPTLDMQEQVRADIAFHDERAEDIDAHLERYSEWNAKLLEDAKVRGQECD